MILVSHIALTSKFVDCCSEKYLEKSQKKNRSRLFFLIFEIKPKNSEKAIFRPAFLVFEKRQTR